MQCNYRGASNLAMEETAALKLGLAAHVDTQFAQYRLVRRRDNHAKEGIATAQLLQPERTRAAVSLVAEVIDSAISVSSVWRRGFLLPRNAS